MNTGLARTMSWLCVAVLLLPLSAWSKPPILAGPGSKYPLVGHYAYEAGGRRHGIAIGSDVRFDEGGKLWMGFGGRRLDGRGAVPLGSGSGYVGADGVLRCHYTDNLGNKGKATLRLTADNDCQVTIDIEEVHDRRCLVFYGTHLMLRDQHAHL